VKRGISTGAFRQHRLRTSRSVADARDLLAQARVIICDLDGCLVEGLEACRGATEFVEQYAEKLRVVSNNSTHTSVALSSELQTLGLSIRPSQCYLAGEFSVARVVERFAGGRVLFVGSNHLREHLIDAGLKIVSEDPDVILLCRDVSITYEKLQRAVTAAYRGAPLIAANPDVSHPNALGEPQLETGALLAAIVSAVPQVSVTLIGKPEADLHRAALDCVPGGSAVVVGDNPDTDIAGARAAGIPSVLIGRHRAAIAPDLSALLA